MGPINQRRLKTCSSGSHMPLLCGRAYNHAVRAYNHAVRAYNHLQSRGLEGRYTMIHTIRSEWDGATALPMTVHENVAHWIEKEIIKKLPRDHRTKLKHS